MVDALADKKQYLDVAKGAAMISDAMSKVSKEEKMRDVVEWLWMVSKQSEVKGSREQETGNRERRSCQ